MVGLGLQASCGHTIALSSHECDGTSLSPSPVREGVMAVSAGPDIGTELGMLCSECLTKVHGL